MKTLLLIGVCIFALIRIIKNLMASQRASTILKETTNNEDYALAFAETLDVTVVIKKNIDVDFIKSALSHVTPSQLDIYTIKSFKCIAPGVYICLTLAKYSDIEYRNNHKNTLATYVMDLNFKIVLDEENKTCRIYSDLHDELTDKILREEFASKFWAVIENKYPHISQ